MSQITQEMIEERELEIIDSPQSYAYFIARIELRMEAILAALEKETGETDEEAFQAWCIEQGVDNPDWEYMWLFKKCWDAAWLASRKRK